ncbi:beta-lactamase family protein, partial [Cellulomonas hominis]|nr:beta-lactamase family protein [Cellulomonas hominis]
MAVPEAHGLPTGALLALLDALEGAGLDPHALVVARDGATLLRAAWAPYDHRRAALVYSVSKSVTALAVGLLADEGRLALDDPV